MQRIDPIIAHLGNPDLVPKLRTALLAALKAGKIQRDRYGQPHQIHHKGAIDLVTEVDIAAEEAILAILYKEQSRATIVAEESHAHYSTGPRGPAWIVDPLDGTTNYAHGFPWFGVSIGYAFDSTIQVGVIYCPMQDELFCAVRNSGAWLNGKRIKVSATNSLKQALVATGFPYDIKQHTQKSLRLWR